MLIKWNNTFEVEVVGNWDKKRGIISNYYDKIIKENQVDNIEIIEEYGDFVDMQLESGEYILCVYKKTFDLVN